MNEIIIPGLAFLAGVVAGGFFFGGLWWTVQKALKTPRPAFLFLVSFVVRVSVVGLIIFLFRDHWQRLGAGLLGFIVARAVLVRWLPRERNSSKQSTRGSHAHQP